MKDGLLVVANAGSSDRRVFAKDGAFERTVGQPGVCPVFICNWGSASVRGSRRRAGVCRKCALERTLQRAQMLTAFHPTEVHSAMARHI